MAVVAAYSLLETVLLLTYLRFDFETEKYKLYAIFGFSLYCTLPFGAALFSRLLSGRNHWVRRALAIVIMGAIGPPVFLVLLFLPVLLATSAFPDQDGVLLFSFLAGISVVTGTLIWIFKKTRLRRLQLEAERWLAQRRSGIDPPVRRLHNRSIGWALSIPSLVVLLTFLFFPELWGCVTHLNRRGIGHLIGFEVPVPATWIIVSRYHNAAEGYSTIAGLVGRGMGRGGLGIPVPLHLAYWRVWTESSAPPSPTHGYRLIGQRVFVVGGARLTCLEYSAGSDQTASFWKAWNDIECSSLDGLNAHFLGDRGNVADFYGMLNQMVQVK